MISGSAGHPTQGGILSVELPEGWYKDQKSFLQVHEQCNDNYEEMSRRTGINVSTVRMWGRRHGLKKPFGPKPALKVVDAGTNDESSFDNDVLKALKKLGDKTSVVELSNELDVSPKRVSESIERLELKGFRLESKDDEIKIHRLPRPSDTEHEVLFEGDTYRFGITSDVHTSSKHCRLDELHIAYDRFVAEGISTVYNPGDIVAGRGIFRGQDHEIINHTYLDQVDFAVENYPQRDGIITKIISGNHDCEGDFGKAGADACLAVANRREDIEWCGRYAADFVLPNGAVLTMRHPMGGSSYAKSYKPQKFAESFEGGSKPGVILFGHWHNMEWGIHRSIHMLNCGTFEGYGGSLGLRVPLGEPAVGFFIVDMTIGEDGSVVRFRPEWFPFFAGRRVG